MQIVLNDKTFIAPSPKARMVRKAIELSETMNVNDMKVADVDALVGWLVDLYGKQFTIDDVYDGLDAEKLMPTLFDAVDSVVGTMGAKLEQLPNARTGA